VPIHNLMEDAATAEIARAQLWQWLHHGGRLEFPDHAPIDFALFDHAHAMKNTTAHRRTDHAGLEEQPRWAGIQRNYSR
jgi:malate synthase